MTPSAEPTAGLERLEETLGYSFRDRGLLVRALTHASRANESRGPEGDNEALEFLGDAILGGAVARDLFDRFPAMDEGGLSKLKAFVVSRPNLAAAARTLDLGAFLRLGGTAERGQGRNRDSLLADALEAVIAAVALDGGDEPARGLVRRLFKAQIDALRRDEVEKKDHKTVLQELLQARGLPTPEYRVERTEGPPHQPVFHVAVLVEGKETARGRGGSKKEAEQRGAREAIRRLRRD
jgi:ribonuclease-3